MGQSKKNSTVPHLAGPKTPRPTPSSYVGRFAPTPSGPLHFGSMVAAVGSYLQARTARGAWRLRIEDLDRPRVVAGAADLIIQTLARFGFEWSGAIEYQSRRLDRYAAALADLRAKRLIYACSCSRAELAANDESRYPGTCRRGMARPEQSAAQRFVVAPGAIAFTDAIQGHYLQEVSEKSGDFIVQRKDGYFAYHLAVVVDDAEQGVTEVVRGADLLDSTPRHISLQRALALPTPTYCHLPVALDASGQKLSKSAQSVPIDPNNAPAVLWRVLDFLRQNPPAALRNGSLLELWQWATAQWTLTPLQHVKSSKTPIFTPN